MKNDILYTIYFADRTVHRTLLNTFRKEGFGISPEQWLIIAFLFHESVRNQQDIANLTGKDKTTITRALEVLIKEGLVRRKVDPEDKRANIVTLTSKGTKLCEKILPVYEKKRAEILKVFSKDKLKACQKALDELIKTLE